MSEISVHGHQSFGVTIGFDKKRGRFIITSPPWDVVRARGIPNRRWIKKERVWSAPAIRANAEYLLERYKDATFSPEAWTAARTAQEVRSHATFDGQPTYAMKTQPKPHQRQANDFIYPLASAALFMGCGSGKSKVLIDDAVAHTVAGHINAAVVVCPYSIRRNWLKELDRHAGILHRAFVLSPMQTKRAQADFDEFVSSKFAGLDVLIVGVESLSQGRAKEYVERFMLARTAAMLVDESSRIKSHNSARTETCVELGKMARIRRVATGTEVTQGLIDLYPQFEFLDPSIIGIGDFYSFRNRYCVMGGYNGKEIVGYDNTEELMDLIRPHTVQLRTDDVLELPPKDPEVRTVQMTAEQKRLYRDIKNATATIGDIELKVQNCLERALRWQQVVDGFFTWAEPDVLRPERLVSKSGDVPGRNPKLEELLAIAEEHAGLSTVIWTPFRRNIERIAYELRRVYGDAQVVEFHGGVPDEERWAARERFETGKARYFIGNPAAGGIGIDLIAASVEVYYSNSSNYEDREQSLWRTRRIGQTKCVKSIDIVGEGSIDETVQAALALKMSLAEYVKDKLSHGQQPFAEVDAD